jgi:NitT/TauT family transport system substrate-binding protein
MAATLATVLAACSSDGGDGSNGDATQIRFGIPTQMGANNSPMAVAEHMGYFADEGLDVEIVNTTDSVSIIQGVDSGSLEIGSTPPEQLWQSIENGGDVQLVYNYIREQTGSIAVRADSGIESLEDLEGAAIGQSSLGSSNLQLSNGILASVGFTEDEDFTNVAVGVGAAALQALDTDRIQALSLWDTEYAAFEENGAELTYLTTPEVASLFSTTYFTSSDYLEENSDAVAGFGRAVARATLFTATNPEAALRIMYEDEQLATDLVSLERRIDLLLAGDPEANDSWGAYTAEAVESWAAFALDSALISSPIDAVSHVGNGLVDQYSDFDGDAVIAEAEEWTP